MAWPDRLLSGSPYPLGATWDGLGTNFAVFSAHATKVELCIFDPSARREIVRFQLPECTDEVWHGYMPNARAGLIYGYLPTSRSMAIASTITSSCSIPMPGASPANCGRRMRFTATG